MSLQLSLIDIKQQIQASRKTINKLKEKWPNNVIFNGSENIYDYHPYIFLPAFPSLTPVGIQPLSVATTLFANSIFLYDKLIDRTSTKYLTAEIALSVQAQQLEVYNLLHQLFPPENLFWQRFRCYMAEYANACIEEQSFAVGKKPLQEYTETVALQIAVGKSCISRATVAGMVELANDDNLLESLVASIDCYNIACQMYDDLRDWKEDLRFRLPSLLLSRVITEWPVESQLDKFQDWSKELARKIYYEGHLSYVMELALEQLDRADAVIENIQIPLWKSEIQQLRDLCQSLLKDSDRIITKNLQRVSQQPKFTLQLQPAQSEWQQLTWDALGFIVEQWQLGFGEARHIMKLSHQEDFGVTEEYHFGDVFQRALIVDALCDANEMLHNQLQPLLDYEATYLVKCRLNSGVGGWSYFPSVPEIAPDADDLGQVMQALLRSGRKAEVLNYCEIPLKILLRDNARTDGSIETWIVPAQGRTPLQERQAEFNQSRWGRGPDNEVMANLLYALQLYDSMRFVDNIQRGVKYLEAQQEDNGSWASRWYYGPYYGTYVCLRLFSLAQPDSPSLERALHFLRNHQNLDGGWGIGDGSDPLSTAIALLGLASTQKNTSNRVDFERVQRALAYLHHSQQPDRGWQKIQFIRPRANNPYSSRTITSIYVLKATVAWYQLMAEKNVDQSKLLSALHLS